MESHLCKGGPAASCVWLRAEGHAAAPLLHTHSQQLHKSTMKTCSRDLSDKAGAQATARPNSVTFFKVTCRVYGLTAEKSEPVLDRQQSQHQKARAMLRNARKNTICHPRAGDVQIQFRTHPKADIAGSPSRPEKGSQKHTEKQHQKYLQGNAEGHK